MSRSKLIIFLIGLCLISIFTSNKLYFILFVMFFVGYLYISHGFIEFYRQPSSITKRPKRFIVSLTSIPSRIQNIHFTIKSLLENTIQPDLIYLNIHKSTSVPQELRSIKNLFINKLDIDFGPLTKLYPTLLKEKDDETVIICVDDDIIYNPYTFEHLLKASEKYPDKCICNTGWSYIDLKFFHIPIILNIPNVVRKVSVLQCYNGVLYKRKFFKNLIFLEQFCLDCKTTDDILISKTLGKENVDIYSIPMSNKHKTNESKNSEKLGSYNMKNMQWIKCIHCP